MSLATKLSQTILNGSKKIAIATALFLTVGISSSFANTTGDGNDAATTSFRKDFKKVEVMVKETGKNFTKFTFKMNEVVLSAYYNENGQLLAITRNICPSQLPVSLLMQVKQNYSDYWISDLFEYNADGSSNYYITLENADYRIVLRSVGTEWEVYDKKVK